MRTLLMCHKCFSLFISSNARKPLKSITRITLLGTVYQSTYLAHAGDTFEEPKENHHPGEDEAEGEVPLQCVSLIIMEALRDLQHEVAAAEREGERERKIH